MYSLSKKSGKTSYSLSCCTKKIQSFVVLTLIFIEIIETNNTSNNNMSQSLSLFHNSALTKSTEQLPKFPLALLPPRRSSITGTVARIKVIYCQREFKLFKMTGVISHICFRAGKRVHSAPVNQQQLQTVVDHSEVVKRGKRQVAGGRAEKVGHNTPLRYEQVDRRERQATFKILRIHSGLVSAMKIKQEKHDSR